MIILILQYGFFSMTETKISEKNILNISFDIWNARINMLSNGCSYGYNLLTFDDHSANKQTENMSTTTFLDWLPIIVYCSFSSL